MINGVAAHLAATAGRWAGLPGIVTLKLRPKALAKSHRPTALLDRAGMLPIGGRRLGELLLPASEQSLRTLNAIINESTAKKIKANISTIAELRPYTLYDVLGLWEGADFPLPLTDWVNAGKPLLIEPFEFDNAGNAEAMWQHLENLIARLDLERLYPGLENNPRKAIFLRCHSVDNVLMLASFPGIRSLSMAPEFSTIDIVQQGFADLGHATIADLPPPALNLDLPTVGVIDSGVSDNDLLLGPWLDGVNIFVLPPETDHAHGTFVSGMIAGARAINGNSGEFPPCAARVHSVAAMGNGSTSTGELLLRIREAVTARPDIKVWNCSLGSPCPGDENSFGYFAEQLDKLADEQNILFVIAAGNYCSVPLRNWPVAAGFASAGEDRISQPGESTRGLTVGSIAHLPNLVAPGDPSPFSRRGPGPAKIPKPEVVHRGGNSCAAGTFTGSGVRSVLPGGRLGESIGTSFSTPLVSVIAANTWHGLQNRADIRPETVKALVIHAAALNSPHHTHDERRYFGFGVPESPLDTLFCDTNTFTLMFEAVLYDGIIWAKTPYPIPACMRPSPGQFQGEVVMTVAYSPPVDGKHGAEYVRANVNASFGKYEPDTEGEMHHHGLVPLDVPPVHDDLYEEALIDHGFKWSPVKVYRKRFPRGVAAETMRLKLELLRRAGEEVPDQPQYATVIVSLRGIEPEMPVYNDGLAALRQTNWVAESIATQTRIRI